MTNKSPCDRCSNTDWAVLIMDNFKGEIQEICELCHVKEMKEYYSHKSLTGVSK